MQYTPEGQTKPETHIFVTEMSGGPDFTDTGHWKSTGGGSTWARDCTFQTHVKGTSKQSIWSAMPIYNIEESRWNIFYVGYESKGWLHGTIFRGYSQTSGYDGLHGPYVDADGSVLSYDTDKDYWEGKQGADSFYPCEQQTYPDAQAAAALESGAKVASAVALPYFRLFATYGG